MESSRCLVSSTNKEDRKDPFLPGYKVLIYLSSYISFRRISGPSYFQTSFRRTIYVFYFQTNMCYFQTYTCYFQTNFRPTPYVYFQMGVLFLDAYVCIFRLIFRRAVLYMTFRFGSVLIRSKKSFSFGWIFGLFCLYYKCNKKLERYVTKCNISNVCNCIHSRTRKCNSKRDQSSC